jgi:hypothetical protein
MVYNKGGTAYFLQIIRMATYCTRDWSYLIPEAQRAPLDTGCSWLKMVTRDIYNLDGWRLLEEFKMLKYKILFIFR